jgi:hypothetical protein
VKIKPEEVTALLKNLKRIQRRKCKKLTRSEIMNKKLECFHPEINSKKCLSSVINTKNSFSQDGRYLNGMKKSQRMIKHENMTKITMLSIIFYLVLPATFLYQRISPFLVILTVYLWFMTLWFLCKVRQQDPGIVPRLELLEGVRRLWNWRF